MSTPYSPFLVANQRVGQDLSMDPWLIPSDAYQEILDGYQFKGVVNKRSGYSWFDSIPYAVNSDGVTPYQNVLSITNGPASVIVLTNDHGLADGDIVRFTDVLGLTASASGAFINKTRWTIKKVDAVTFSINNTDAFGGTYTALTGTCSQMPLVGTTGYGTTNGLPVTMIANWVDLNGNPTMVICDTQRMAYFDTSATNNCLVPIGNTNYFTGGETNLFWWENYMGYLFITNNKDPIFYLNDLSTQQPVGPTAFTPQLTSSANDIVNNCLMIKAVNNRLCLYNTNETVGGITTQNSTRVRWCAAVQDPTVPFGTPAYSPWDQLIPGYGDYFDLAGSNYLISQGQLQYNNILISQGQVYATFYEQRPLGNDPNNPYAFVVIATSKNVNTTFGTTVLDRQLNAYGNTGIITCDGNTVGRIDERIPEYALNNIEQSQFDRCFGIRNDALWQTWLLYTAVGNTRNSNVLIFNYMDRSWSTYNLSMSCLGLFQNPQPDPTWVSYGSVLPDYSWEDFDEETWATLNQSQAPMLFGGDYNGSLWWMDSGGGDAADNVVYGGSTNNGNEIVMQLTTRQWFPYAQEGKASQFGYVDFLIEGDYNTVVECDFSVDNQASPYKATYFPCIPLENLSPATIDNVTQAANGIVTSIDHGLITGQVIYIFAVQGMIELNNNDFAVTVIDSDHFFLNANTTTYGSYISGGLITFEPLTQGPFWTRVWSGQIGVFHQIKLIAAGINETFALHASMPWFRGTGRIYRG